jgi:hypothetical protein
MRCPHCERNINYVRAVRDAYCYEYFTVDADGEEEHDEYGDHNAGDNENYSCPECSEEISRRELVAMQDEHNNRTPSSSVPVQHDVWKGLV